MRLLYCYVAFTDREGNVKPLRGMKELELNFSPTYVYRYDVASDTLCQFPRETPLPDQFWANGTPATNICNINVIAGMNGSGKSTAIQYLMDLLNYVYHGFGQTLSDQERFVRNDPTDNRNLLLFETDENLFILDLWHGEMRSQLHTEGFEKQPLLKSRKEAQALLQRMKIINLTNTLTRRDYLLHVGSKNERLRNDFVYDCAIGATIGPDVEQYFFYEVYKQVKYLFDSHQMKARKNLKKTIPELRLPRVLRLHPLWRKFEKPIEGIIGKEFLEVSLFSQFYLSVQLAVLCLVSYVENMQNLIGRPIFVYPRLFFFSEPITNKLALREELLASLDQAEKWFRTLLRNKYQFISGSEDGTLQVWDTDTSHCLYILEGHEGPVSCVTVLPGGRVVSGSYDCTLRVWNTAIGQCLCTLKGHKMPVSCVTVLPDGRVVSGSDDCTLRVWDAATGQCLYTLEGHKMPVLCVTVLPDGRVVSGSDDSTLRVWDAATGQCLYTLEGHNEPVLWGAVLQDGRVVSGSRDNTIRVWDPVTGQCRQILERQGHREVVGCVAVLPEKRPDDDPAVRLIIERAERCRAYINYVMEDPDDIFSQFMTSDGNIDVFELPLPQEKSNASEQLEESLVKFLDLYHKICTPYYTLDFDWGLSSGEENLLRMFSWLFHIFPRTGENGEYRYQIRNNPDNIYDGGKKCDSILLIMDEADLTFHPEWQRRLIHILTAFIPTIYPPDCVKDLQMILTTHSPLLLGDIPRENIHFLCRKENADLGQVQTESETFGQNIHTILKDSFFLDHGSVGQFAANKIDELAKRLEALRQPEFRSNVSAKEMETIRGTIALVAPGVLRAKLEQMLREVEVPNVETLAQQTRLLSNEERQWLLRRLQEEEK